jgi:diadenosine tetraphosphate (Ap4A) HIT family hydrolase
VGVIADRAARLRAGEDPSVLVRVTSGFVVLNERQPEAVRGACLLVPSPVVPSVQDLDTASRAAFFRDLCLLGDAVVAATGAERANYLILCNQAPELHAHVIPRFASEDPVKRRLGPFEAYDFGSAPVLDVAGEHAALRERLVDALRATGIEVV